MQFSSLLGAVVTSSLAGLGQAIPANSTLALIAAADGKTQDRPAVYPQYTIPESYAHLLGAPGAPDIGQPVLTVTLQTQVRHDRRTGQNHTTQHLILHAGSFVGGQYSDVDLFLACHAPGPTAAGGRGLPFNFSYNCRVGHNQLDARCEVPLQHLARYKAKKTGCAALGRENVFACGQKLRIALRARAAKAGSPAPFDIWAQGRCVSDPSKVPCRDAPSCLNAADMAQYVEVDVTCPKGLGG